MEGWASVKKAAQYADVSVRTMRDWLKEGLKHSRLPSGTIRIRYSDVNEYLEQFQVNEHAIDAMVDEVVREFI
jgi:excisionase family DNA binding protein